MRLKVLSFQQRKPMVYLFSERAKNHVEHYGTIRSDVNLAGKPSKELRAHRCVQIARWQPATYEVEVEVGDHKAVCGKANDCMIQFVGSGQEPDVSIGRWEFSACGTSEYVAEGGFRFHGHDALPMCFPASRSVDLRRGWDLS
jgi:hypothetical protein